MRASLVAAVAALTLPLLAATPAPAEDAGAVPGAGERRALPRLKVTTVRKGLDNPWDVQSIGRGRLLYTERDRGTITLLRDNGKARRVRLRGARVWVEGETGMMSLEVDPRFAKNRRIYTCSGWRTKRGREVRVVAWRMSERLRSARRVRTLIDRIPADGGGIHGGCRLLILRDGSLLVGTGDARIGRNPQRLRSLGGKTLRLDRMTGRPWPRNRWAGAKGNKRYVFTYGHRNVQGLAQRGDGTLWSVEHGTDRDDEVNRLRRGGNYGWHPVPGYNQSVPMTDHSLPGTQYGAAWRSGFPTIATSGAAFVGGDGWGRLKGTLAVGVLKGSRVLFVKLDDRGRLKWTRAPRALRQHGRLRSVTRVGSALLVTTSNGSNDKILRVTPRR